MNYKFPQFLVPPNALIQSSAVKLRSPTFKDLPISPFSFFARKTADALQARLGPILKYYA